MIRGFSAMALLIAQKRKNGRYSVADIVMHKAGSEDVLPSSDRARLDAEQ